MKPGRLDWLKLAAMAGAGLFPATGKVASASGQTQGANSAAPQKRSGNGADPRQTLPPEATNGSWCNLRAVKEKKVFDVHCHPWGLRPGQKDATDNTKELLEAMDYYGIAQAALSPSPHTAYEEQMKKDTETHPDRFVKASGLPTDATRGQQLTPDLVAEQCRVALERDGCKLIGETEGGTLMGLQARYSVGELKPIIDVVRKYDVPVLLHTGLSVGATPVSRNWPDSMGAILAQYPDVKFILGHTGGPVAIPDGHEALRLLFWYDNAYVDTSTSPLEIINEAVKGVGSERVMFASDWNAPGLQEAGPFHMRAVYTHWWNLNNIANADLSEDQRDWVLYKSARKLLKLPEA